MDFAQLDGATRHTFSKGEWLIHPGERVEYVYYIISGFVIGSITNENGNEYLYDELPENAGIRSVALLGMLFDNDRISIVGSVALTDIDCYRIPASSILNYLHDHPEDLFQFTAKLMHLYIDNIKKHTTRCEKKTIERLCQFLLEHSEDRGGELFYPKTLTNEELAKVLGVHPVTLSRMFGGLRERGYIEKTHKGWCICDVQALVDCMRGVLEVAYRQ